MADKTTNMVDTTPKKVATLPMIFKFFKVCTCPLFYGDLPLFKLCLFCFSDKLIHGIVSPR